MSAADLKILQVNTSDSGGGAEKVASGLHRCYLERGLDAWLAVGERASALEHVAELPNEQMRGAWAAALTRTAARVATPPVGMRRLAGRALLLAAEPSRYAAVAQGVEDFDFPGTARLFELSGGAPDVLHLHNLHGYYFDLRRLPELSAGQPTILTMHDPWPLTGHCAHPIDCPRWRVGCGNCPDLERYVPIRKDASARNFIIKRDALGRSDLCFATPSQWLMRMTEESGVLGDSARARVIPNGVDTAVFGPGDRAAARDALGLPLDAEIVLLAAKDLSNNPFKDYRTLAAALGLLAHERERLVLVALGDEDGTTSIEGVDVRAVPFVEDQAQVAQYYRAADGYVHAARAENLPLAVIEAMACGTPVVASAVGGVPEIVVDGECGSLVAPGDATALAGAVGYLLDDAALRDSFARAGLVRVSERFTLQRQADAYLEWYAELRAGR